MLTIAVAVLTGAACSTFSNAGSDGLTTSFFMPPQNVWSGIERTLVDLDYLITDQNRTDGVIRAESSKLEGGAVVILNIDQIMRTNDQVHVYVKPADGGGDRAATPEELEAAGKAFVSALDLRLNP
jgi:hypothetical protein